MKDKLKSDLGSKLGTFKSLTPEGKLPINAMGS